jgi:hypothetical protein
MRVRWIFLFAFCTVAAVAHPGAAAAQQAQDWMVGAGKKGTYVNLDLIVGAVQGTFEHRVPIYGGANMLTLRAGGLAALPFGSSQVDAELRILNLTLGTSAGYMSVWRNKTFDLGAPMHRRERREREAAGDFNRDVFPFWEGRASMGFVLNDYVVFNHITTYRLTDATERSFDNLNNIVHDGDFARFDFQLFFKHKDIGSLAPVVQLVNFGLDGERHTQANYGFMFLSRAGLVQRDDLILFQMMFHPGAVFGAYDNSDVYGAALWRGPFTLLLAYRSVIRLDDGETDYSKVREEKRAYRAANQTTQPGADDLDQGL